MCRADSTPLRVQKIARIHHILCEINIPRALGFQLCVGRPQPPARELEFNIYKKMIISIWN